MRRVAAGGSGAVAEGVFGCLGKWWAAPCAYEFLESALACGCGARAQRDDANSTNSSAVGLSGEPAAAGFCVAEFCVESS